MDSELYIHVIGNGESDTQRSNAHTLNKHGAAYYAGAVMPSTIFLKDLSDPYTYGIQIINGELKTFIKTSRIIARAKSGASTGYTPGASFRINDFEILKYNERGDSFPLDSSEIIYTKTVPEDLKIQISYIEHGFEYKTEIQLTPASLHDDFEWAVAPTMGTQVAVAWKGTHRGNPSTIIEFPINCAF